MNVFISSLITGFEEFRTAAARGASDLGHSVIRAEDFGASTDSPQQVCLAGIRKADVVLLVLGERYGTKQGSGVSATHEEFNEARESRPVLVFVQKGARFEPEQEAFLTEVRNWGSGRFTDQFANPDELRSAVARALHQHALAMASGQADEAEIRERAAALAPTEAGHADPALCLIVAAGPRQQIIRPADLEQKAFIEQVVQQGMFGPTRVLDWACYTQYHVAKHALHIEQDKARLFIDEEGSVRICQAATEDVSRNLTSIPCLIEEHVRETIEREMLFAGWILDYVDPIRRLSDVVMLASLTGAQYLSWQTKAEHAARPTEGTMGSGGDEVLVHLSQPRRHRAALLHDTKRISEDLTVLLRSQMK
ncbi:MAG TPA: DUF4062 domain-containing protein [Armatimonadota bacterium]|jgi:hypothetical protein